MKKLLSILISAIMLSGCICAIAACGKREPEEQINNMTVKSITQNAYGSVHVTLDVSQVDFSKPDGVYERWYNVQPSLDGGQTWVDGTVYLAESVTQNGEFSFDVISYAGDGNFYLLGYQDPEYRIECSAGDKFNFSFRFKAYEHYLDSEATEPVEVTMKNVTEIKFDGASCGENLPSGDDTRYIFQKQSENDSFKLFKIVCVFENGEYVTEYLEEVEASVLERFEYKFISQSDLKTVEGMYYLKDELKYLEDNTDTAGWKDYSSGNGITREDYKNNVTHFTDSFDAIAPDGTVVGKVDYEAEYVLTMVRLKRKDNQLKSGVNLVYLYLYQNYSDIIA